MIQTYLEEMMKANQKKTLPDAEAPTPSPRFDPPPNISGYPAPSPYADTGMPNAPENVQYPAKSAGFAAPDTYQAADNVSPGYAARYDSNEGYRPDPVEFWTPPCLQDSFPFPADLPMQDARNAQPYLSDVPLNAPRSFETPQTWPVSSESYPVQAESPAQDFLNLPNMPIDNTAGMVDIPAMPVDHTVEMYDIPATPQLWPDLQQNQAAPAAVSLEGFLNGLAGTVAGVAGEGAIPSPSQLWPASSPEEATMNVLSEAINTIVDTITTNIAEGEGASVLSPSQLWPLVAAEEILQPAEIIKDTINAAVDMVSGLIAGGEEPKEDAAKAPEPSGAPKLFESSETPKLFEPPEPPEPSNATELSPFSIPPESSEPAKLSGQGADNPDTGSGGAVEEVKDVKAVKDDYAPTPSLLRPDPEFLQLRRDAEEAVATAVQARPATEREPSVVQPMGTGLLQVHVTTGKQAVPVKNARVVVTRPDGEKEILLKIGSSDSAGNTPPLSLPAVQAKYSLHSGSVEPTLYTIETTAPGYYRVRHIHVPLYGGVASVQEIEMTPLPEGEDGDQELLYDQATLDDTE